MGQQLPHPKVTVLVSPDVGTVSKVTPPNVDCHRLERLNHFSKRLDLPTDPRPRLEEEV